MGFNSGFKGLSVQILVSVFLYRNKLGSYRITAYEERRHGPHWSHLTMGRYRDWLCEHGIVPSGYQIDRECLERLSHCQMLKEVPALYR